MVTQLQSWIRQLASIGNGPADTEDERLAKEILTFSSSVVAAAAVLWGLVYMALGLYASGAIPLAYAAISFVGLYRFYRTKRYNTFRFSQLLLTLLLPFLLAWSLGGFTASSVVMSWALLAPLGALMFVGTAHATPWFVAYLLLVVFSGLIDARMQQHAAHMPQIVHTVFYVTNIGAPSALIYVLLLYFVRERERSQERSEQLLLNILPKPIADRLKHNPGIIADRYRSVTILFVDIVDFTRLSARIDPEELVAVLNDVFTSFDELADRHGLEKIKTIGDAYMAVSGLPQPRPDHAQAAAEMALDMLAVLSEHPTRFGDSLSVRIGINTGPVVAGVIGRRKFIYDLWGDAVNTASRMESHGLSDRIQATEAVYLSLRDHYEFEERGEIEVKGKGRIMTYFLLGRKERATNVGERL